MKIAITATSTALALVLSGCTGGSQQSSAPATSAASRAALTNPTEFPLGPGTTILDVKPFSQVVVASATGSSMLGGQGSGTYAGYEVLAGSTQSASGLRAWLAQLGEHPPAGYVYETGSSSSSAKVSRTLDQYGVAFAAFRRENPSTRRGVVIVAMDPKLVKEKLGLALDLVDRYRELPEMLRGPIDRQFKGSTGFTISQATDPSSPLGMTLNALRELQNSDERAVVMIDGTKK